jgi:hypothetical protein
MTEPQIPPPATIGFLTVVEHADPGLFGGYLVLNAAGRPLEFHCTAPVKPNRAQEILFGATLAPYLEGELIAAALLSRAKSPPLVVCTDRSAVLAVRPTVEFPIVLALEEGIPIPPGLSPLGLGVHRAASSHEDRITIEETCATLLASLDLLEPFSRIREAIDEARTSASKPVRSSAA